MALKTGSRRPRNNYFKISLLLGYLFRVLLIIQIIFLITRDNLLQRLSFRIDIVAFFVVFIIALIGSVFPEFMYHLIRKNIRLLRRYWQYILSWLIVGLILFEILIRFYFSGTVLTYQQTLTYQRFIIDGQPVRFEGIYQPTNLYTYQLKPNLNTHIVDRLYTLDYHLQTNEQGFRVVEGKSMINQGNIMFLGDSVTLGVGVNQGETFVDKLQTDWFKQYDLHNFGVSGWGFAEYYLAYKDYAETLKPKLVVIGVYPTNDFDNLRKAIWPDREKGDLPKAPLTRQDLYIDSKGDLRLKTIRYQVPLLRNSAGFIFIMQFMIEPLLAWVINLIRLYREAVANTELSLNIISEISHDTPVLVLILPSEVDYPEPQFLPEGYTEALKEIDNVYVLDIYPVVEDTYTNAFVDRYHFNPETHQQVANEIYQFIAKQNILPITQ